MIISRDKVKKLSGNLVLNPGFSGEGASVTGWSFESPRSELSPEYFVKSEGHENSKCEGCDNSKSLGIAANGDRQAFGCWRGEADLKVGEWYLASVKVRIKGIAEPDLSVFAQFAQHYLEPVAGWSEETVLEQVFKVKTDYEGRKIELYLRSAETGSVEWYEPCIVRIAPPEFRTARIATVRFADGVADAELTLEGQRARIAAKLEQAGALKPDLVVLPEFSPVVGVEQKHFISYHAVGEAVPDGPTCRVIAEAAAKYGMYVTAGVIEKRGKYLLNTAVIFDRSGSFVGQYDKTHLTFYELMDGFSCGRGYPVFDLDFGRIAIHICYDEWFPEVSRYYALQGAEILLLPVAGGKPITWRTRALDNGIYFVSSSITPPSMIIDSSGEIIAETYGDGIAYADLNLDYRKVNYYGDPTLTYSMPCVKPQRRNVADNELLEKLAELYGRR